MNTDFKYAGNGASCLLLFLSVCLIYIWSMPDAIVLEDDGYFVLTAYYNGIAHPPGYPLYILLAKLFSLIPVDTIAWRVHLLSAVLGALTVVCIWLLTLRYLLSPLIAWLVALLLAFSEIFWSQSIIAEVYTLNTLLFFVAILICLDINTTTDVNRLERLWRWLALTCGLGLANHWPLFILSSPLLFCLLLPEIKSVSRYGWGIAFWFFVGLSPYVWMVIRSHMDPGISFIGPINNWSDFWFYISREGYASQDHSLTSGWWDKQQFIGYAMRELAEQYGPFGFWFVIFGFFMQWRYLPRLHATGLTLAFLGNTILLIFLLGFDYDLLHQNIFRIYPMVAYCIGAIWAGFGIYTIFRVITKYAKDKLDIRYIQVLILLLLVPVTLLANLGKNYRTNDDWAERYARVVLDSVDKDAVIFTYGDLTVGPLGYLNLIKGVRSDVDIYNTQGLVFPNRLFRPYRYTDEEWRTRIKQFIDATSRPVYYLDHFPNPYGAQDFGLLFKVDKSLEQHYRQAIVIPEIMGYFEALSLLEEPVDPWEGMHHRGLIGDYCGFLAVLSSQGLTMPEDFLMNTCDSYLGSLKYAEILLTQKDPDWMLVNRLLVNARNSMEEATNLIDRSLFAYYQGEYHRRQHQPEKAKSYYRMSLSLWPADQNSAWKRIAEMVDIGTGAVE